MFEWIIFFAFGYTVNHTEAQAICQSFGWKLFGNVNGTLEQVKLICSMHGANHVWLAVSDEVLILLGNMKEKKHLKKNTSHKSYCTWRLSDHNRINFASFCSLFSSCFILFNVLDRQVPTGSDKTPLDRFGPIWMSLEHWLHQCTVLFTQRLEIEI